MSNGFAPYIVKHAREPVGTKFGYWELIDSLMNRFGKVFCLCTRCNKKALVNLGNLRSGRTKSCCGSGIAKKNELRP